ncbi:MAG: hypothetical protein LWW91_04045 [Bacteroidales bacterium]|nr:hypothetical protein [Bacteroidales bacterium]
MKKHENRSPETGKPVNVEPGLSSSGQLPEANLSTEVMPDDDEFGSSGFPETKPGADQPGASCSSSISKEAGKALKPYLLTEFEPMLRAAYLREVTGPIRLEDEESPTPADDIEMKLAVLADKLSERFKIFSEGLKLGPENDCGTLKNARPESPKRQEPEKPKPAVRNNDELRYSEKAESAVREHEKRRYPEKAESAVRDNDELREPGQEVRRGRPPKSNVLKIKGLHFGMRIILLYQYLLNKKAFPIAQQIVRCGRGEYSRGECRGEFSRFYS